MLRRSAAARSPTDQEPERDKHDTDDEQPLQCTEYDADQHDDEYCSEKHQDEAHSRSVAALRAAFTCTGRA
jgi:hypothetical protein